MRQIPQVTQHACIFDGALLAGLVALVAGMWTQECKHPLQNRRGKLQPRRKDTIVYRESLEVVIVGVGVACSDALAEAVSFLLVAVVLIMTVGLGRLESWVAVVVELSFVAGGFRLLAPPEELGDGELHDHRGYAKVRGGRDGVLRWRLSSSQLY